MFNPVTQSLMKTLEASSGTVESGYMPHHITGAHTKLAMYASLFVFSLLFNQFVSWNVNPQASMDAAYYSIVADRWISGQGLSEPVIWHHLQPYTQIIRPIDYWQPLCAVIIGLARSLIGSNGPIFINHLLWSVVSVLIFADIMRCNKSLISACAGYACFVFCGKYLFYISTTDNIALYAGFGYLLLKYLSTLPVSDNHLQLASAGKAGFICGLMSLTRIDGVVFTALSLFTIAWYRLIRAVGVFLIVFFVTISPWVYRNLQTLGTPWTTNTRALFLKTYEDFFDREKELTLKNYLNQGWKWIVSTKAAGLQKNLYEFFLVPTHILLLPFWLGGLALLKGPLAAQTAGFAIVLWFLNGVLFTTQSVYGTAFHISAALFPHFAMFCGSGAGHLAEQLSAKFLRCLKFAILAGFIIYVAGFSLFAVSTIRREYEKELAPYKSLQALNLIEKGKAVLSTHPILVHLLFESPGVMLPYSGLTQADKTAREYECEFILLDTRAQKTPVASCSFSDWQLLYASSPLYLWKDSNPSR